MENVIIEVIKYIATAAGTSLAAFLVTRKKFKDTAKIAERVEVKVEQVSTQVEEAKVVTTEAADKAVEASDKSIIAHMQLNHKVEGLETAVGILADQLAIASDERESLKKKNADLETTNNSLANKLRSLEARLNTGEFRKENQ